MPEKPIERNDRRSLQELPVLSKEWREFPERQKVERLRETDENGDVIFRFKVDLSDPTGVASLESFYRSTIRDLLKIVRFFHQGTPVIVDEFAFLNDPHDRLSILEDTKTEVSSEEMKRTS